MRFGSVCSGIEAASVAWHPLGWRAAFLSEIESFPRAVLSHHYPTTPLHGDFTTIQAGDYEPIDLLVGGTPCQSFSVAGLRGGLADERGNLALEYLRLVQRLRPRWIVWENVPGVLSSYSHDAPDPRSPPDNMAEGSEWVGEDEYDADESHAFACFLAGLSELGYGFAYRSLDAQYFGLAQRRQRVFVVGYHGDWRRAAAVLFEPASLRRNTPPCRQAGQDAAGTLSARCSAGGGLGTDSECAGGVIPTVATTLTARSAKGVDSDCTTTLIAHTAAYRTSPNCGACDTGDRIDALTTGTDRTSHPISQPYTLAIRGRSDSYDLEYRQDGTANALVVPNGGRAGIGVGAVAFHESGRGKISISDTASCLTLGGGKPGQGYQAAQIGSAVRRLMPIECERLQGFADGYTDIPCRGKPASDALRYRALGNSMAVPVMAWIGRRIAQQDADIQARRKVAA